MFAQVVDYVKDKFRDCYDPLAAHIMDIWAGPPQLTVYGPSDIMHHEWYATQVYRVAVEIA